MSDDDSDDDAKEAEENYRDRKVFPFSNIQNLRYFVIGCRSLWGRTERFEFLSPRRHFLLFKRQNHLISSGNSFPEKSLTFGSTPYFMFY